MFKCSRVECGKEFNTIAELRQHYINHEKVIMIDNSLRIATDSMKKRYKKEMWQL